MNPHSEETYTTEQASQQALLWCQTHRGWQRICDIDNSDSLYKTWPELPQRERNSWIKAYGPHSAESAWQEFGIAPCKVPKGFISGKGEFYKDILQVPHYHNLMTVYKTL